MQKFTEAYDKAKDVLVNQKFADAWQTNLAEKWQAVKLFGGKGFNRGHSKVTTLVRQAIADAAKKDGQKPGEVIYDAAVNPKSGGSLAERAATLKFIKHLYRARTTGGQSVWVYAPPLSDATWVFDEITGDATTMKARLNHDNEIFSAQERKWMSTSLHTARKICEDVKHKLSGGNPKTMSAETLAMVQRWFNDEDSTADDTAATAKKLLAGFKKITRATSATTLVFTDYPDWRAQRDKYFGAAFRGGEGGGFPIIYLEGAFTRLTGNSGKEWLCAETIIHELSHHEVSTQDHRYDHHGLKPNKATFPASDAIDNADSWGYFALDLAGYLSNADFAKVYK